MKTKIVMGDKEWTFEFDSPIEALDQLVEIINGVSDEKRVAVLYSSDIDVLTDFADTFRENKDHDIDMEQVQRVVNEKLR